MTTYRMLVEYNNNRVIEEASNIESVAAFGSGEKAMTLRFTDGSFQIIPLDRGRSFTFEIQEPK